MLEQRTCSPRLSAADHLPTRVVEEFVRRRPGEAVRDRRPIAGVTSEVCGHRTRDGMHPEHLEASRDGLVIAEHYFSTCPPKMGSSERHTTE